MHKISNFITHHSKLILIIAILLMIPSIIGYKSTKINYDIISFLPDNIETVQGEKLLNDEFHMGAYSIILVDKDIPAKNVLKMEDDIKQIDSVSQVLGIYDVTGTSVPEEMIPSTVKDKIEKNGYLPMIVTFKTGLSDDKTFEAIDKIKLIVGNDSLVSGISAVTLDTKKLADKEVGIYVAIAVGLCLLVLEIALDSFVVPIILLLGIGIAIVYNLGTNVFLGSISYITKAIAAVLQLGVTMDFSIFLYHSFQRMKAKDKDPRVAMANAIDETFISIIGSSTTTIAGFLALCAMELTLGRDIGIVMAKGVLLGLITVVTILPALMLETDKLITKTTKKEFVPKFAKLNGFVTKHYKPIVGIFVLLLIPAVYGNSHVKVYYNLDESLPRDLDSIVATQAVADNYNMVSTQIALVDKNMDANKMSKMIDDIKALDGVEWVLSEDSLHDLNIPSEALPSKIKDTFESDNYKMIIINSTYKIATDEENALVDKINDVIKSYDDKAILAGEAPLTKDLVKIADRDFQMVNLFSIGVILIIMVFVLKSASLPIILVGVIEFAISVNMAISYYTGKTLVFIASIVIGTIQLGATVDYAILITTKYLDNRRNGMNKFDAVTNSLNDSVKSIIVSAFCFFAATFGVAMISDIDVISSICMLIARGAIISMLCVMFILPAALLLFDKLIIKTTKNMKMVKN